VLYTGVWWEHSKGEGQVGELCVDKKRGWECGFVFMWIGFVWLKTGFEGEPFNTMANLWVA